jgi:hypothetical protein
MNAKDVQLIQEEEKHAKEWNFQLPFNISNNRIVSSNRLSVNLVDYVAGVRKYICCGGKVAGIARAQSDYYPEPSIEVSNNLHWETIIR